MMVNDPHDKIIDKIDKLLRLSRSDNENEARAAMVKAQELIAKHNISREELGQEEERQVVTMTSQAFGEEWVQMVAGVIASNFRCRALTLMMYSGNFKIRFFGFYKDAVVCINIFQYAIKVIRKRFGTLRAIYESVDRKFGGDEKFSYVTGFCAGLQKNFDEQKQNDNQFALALVVPEEVNNFVDSIPGVEQSNFQEPKLNKAHRLLQQNGYIDGKAFQNAGDKERLRGSGV